MQLLDAGRRHRKPKPEEWVPSPSRPKPNSSPGRSSTCYPCGRSSYAPFGRCCAAREAPYRAGRHDGWGHGAGSGPVPPTPPALSIEGAIGPHRRWAVARTSLDELKVIRSTLGGTVNDVVLTAITGALRDLLLDR